jgi:hypothetical protein
MPQFTSWIEWRAEAKKQEFFLQRLLNPNMPKTKSIAVSR